MSPEKLPPSFIRRIVELYDERGAQWLRELPSHLEQAEVRWSIRIFEPFPELTYNFVAPAKGQDHGDLVFKAGVPNPELTAEIETLRMYNGDGMVRLVAGDHEQGQILMERLIPGMPLSTIENDGEAVAIASRVMRRLQRKIDANPLFPTVADWAKGFQRLRYAFNGGEGPFPQDLVELAERLSDDLLSSMSESVLLHGDLHHGNILSAARSPWLALDPKGVIGEPEYEVGAFLRNPMPELAANPDLDRILSHRVDQFADELGFDRERILGWGLVQAVLSGWWSYEDHGHGWEPAIFIARSLKRHWRRSP